MSDLHGDFDNSSTAQLPREGAFVVQLAAHSRVEHGRWRGRVEHVASGQAVAFESIDDLQAFVVAVLGQGGSHVR